MTKISQIAGTSIKLADDDWLEKERNDGISEKFRALQIKEYVFSNEIVVPAGSNQAGATQLTAYDNHIDVVSAPGVGIKFLPAVQFMRQRVKHRGAFWVWMYPTSGHHFIGLAVDQPMKLNPGMSVEVVCFLPNELRV